MNFLLKSIGVLGLIVLQSCGGDGTNPLIPGGGDSTTELRIGSGVGASFSDKAIGLTDDAITEGGSTNLTVNFVDANGNLSAAAGTVTFTSICISGSQASLSANDITIVGSSATTTYTDSSCSGADSITASALMDDGSTLTAAGTVTISEILRIGSGSGASFQPSVVSIVSPNILSAGTTSLSVNIVDANNTLVTDNPSVTFTSNCQSNGLASFNPATATTFDGAAQTTYVDQGCIGSDFVTATLQGATSSTATGQITILPLRLGSGSAASFVESVVSISQGTINSGDRTTVSVNIVDSDGNLQRSPVSITFTSTCSAKSPQEAEFIPSSLITSTGTATATYIDNGCPGSDLIRAELENGTSAPNPSAINTVIITPLRIGTGSLASFNEGAINLTPSAITEAEETDVSVNIVDSNGGIITSPTGIRFSSTCADATPPTASFTSTSIVTSSGTATTKYKDAGCPSDTIIATLDAAGSIDPTASGPITITPLRIGSGSGDPGFNQNVVTLGVNSISAGGTTSVSVNVVDAASNLITNPVTVIFESNCVTQGSAAFDNTSASTINGVASVTFTAATGCTGTDTIRAKINPYGNNERVAQASLTIASPGLGSIQFTSTDEDVIALAGTGTAGKKENATLTFTVFDSTSQPLADTDVTFSLSTVLGGITLQATTDTSDANGLVQAIVQSGTVATSVRVTATVTNDTSKATQSTAIVISTGLPDQDSFSLSADILNPNAWNKDGVQVNITARLSDRYNNPIQDETNISFTTELGQIISSCSTVDGACSTIWTSSQPRGLSGPGTNSGRTTILAHVVGEESFNDANGDGIFSTGDTFSDIPEPFVDWDEDGVRDNGTSSPDASYNGTPENFQDFNNNFTYDSTDGEFNGVGCTHPTDCSTQETTFVSRQIVLVMSEASPRIIRIDSSKDNSAPLCDNTDTNLTNDCYSVIDSITGVATGTSRPNIFYVGNIPETLIFTIAGQTNYQVLPLGTTIDYSVDNGKILSGASHIVPNTNSNTYQYQSQIPTAQPKTVLSPTNLGVAQYPISLGADTTPSNDGSLSIEINTGDLIRSTSIAINDLPSTISITAPASSITVATGTGFTLSATASSPSTGDETSNIVWASNIAGTPTIASGGVAKEVNGAGSAWPIGTHTITATSTQTDPDSIVIVASVVVIIQ